MAPQAVATQSRRRGPPVSCDTARCARWWRAKERRPPPSSQQRRAKKDALDESGEDVQRRAGGPSKEGVAGEMRTQTLPTMAPTLAGAVNGGIDTRSAAHEERVGLAQAAASAELAERACTNVARWKRRPRWQRAPCREITARTAEKRAHGEISSVRDLNCSGETGKHVGVAQDSRAVRQLRWREGGGTEKASSKGRLERGGRQRCGDASFSRNEKYRSQILVRTWPRGALAHGGCEPQSGVRGLQPGIVGDGRGRARRRRSKRNTAQCAHRQRNLRRDGQERGIAARANAMVTRGQGGNERWSPLTLSHQASERNVSRSTRLVEQHWERALRFMQSYTAVEGGGSTGRRGRGALRSCPHFLTRARDGPSAAARVAAACRDEGKMAPPCAVDAVVENGLEGRARCEGMSARDEGTERATDSTTAIGSRHTHAVVECAVRAGSTGAEVEEALCTMTPSHVTEETSAHERVNDALVCRRRFAAAASGRQWRGASAHTSKRERVTAASHEAELCRLWLPSAEGRRRAGRKSRHARGSDIDAAAEGMARQITTYARDEGEERLVSSRPRQEIVRGGRGNERRGGGKRGRERETIELRLHAQKYVRIPASRDQKNSSSKPTRAPAAATQSRRLHALVALARFRYVRGGCKARAESARSPAAYEQAREWQRGWEQCTARCERASAPKSCSRQDADVKRPSGNSPRAGGRCSPRADENCTRTVEAETRGGKTSAHERVDGTLVCREKWLGRGGEWRVVVPARSARRRRGGRGGGRERVRRSVWSEAVAQGGRAVHTARRHFLVSKTLRSGDGDVWCAEHRARLRSGTSGPWIRGLVPPALLECSPSIPAPQKSLLSRTRAMAQGTSASRHPYTRPPRSVVVLGVRCGRDKVAPVQRLRMDECVDGTAPRARRQREACAAEGGDAALASRVEHNRGRDGRRENPHVTDVHNGRGMDAESGGEGALPSRVADETPRRCPPAPSDAVKQGGRVRARPVDDTPVRRRRFTVQRRGYDALRRQRAGDSAGVHAASYNHEDGQGVRAEGKRGGGMRRPTACVQPRSARTSNAMDEGTRRARARARRPASGDTVAYAQRALDEVAIAPRARRQRRAPVAFTRLARRCVYWRRVKRTRRGRRGECARGICWTQRGHINHGVTRTMVVVYDARGRRVFCMPNGIGNEVQRAAGSAGCSPIYSSSTPAGDRALFTGGREGWESGDVAARPRHPRGPARTRQRGAVSPLHKRTSNVLRELRQAAS
ncbi:hypothetical protein K438DRAFT_1789804 [Mycena galopus ATCC 62051]|nr:hypothetical protein K438DRAFT_1789804 [Mycena galopus ATCC 62051]